MKLKYWGIGEWGETVEASGPWEARFKFCGIHQISPDEVRVIPPLDNSNEFTCIVGKSQVSPYVKLGEEK